ncbi:MAG: transglutaminase-like domain-containing protein, partial [Phycisphaeraceae bacterium]
PNAGYQRTEWIDADTLRVTVDLDRPTWPERFEVDDETLSASSMLNHEDEAIQSLTSQAVDLQMLNAQSNKPTLSPLYKAERDAAEKLRLFVRGHIERKDLSVGFASASETARTQQGDCTEHACLLAAMLRGAGIPSRTVTGLVYADQFAGREGVFGFHMWTQAWLTDDQNKPRWVDLDAAAPGQINGFDATHLALSTSTMADDSGFNDMVPLLPLMQGMQIKVIELAWSDD